MKIAFDSTIFQMQKYGGVSRYFVQLSKQLIYHSEDIRIFAPLHSNHLLRDVREDITCGIYSNFAPPRLSSAFRFLNRWAARRRIDSWNPDIVHETWYHPHRSASAKFRTITTVHDMIHELFPKSFSKQDPTAERKKISVRRADHVICVSENTRNDLIRLTGISPNKVSVVHLGIDSPPSNPESRDLSHGNRPFILYVGGRGGYKNFRRLLESIASKPFLKNEVDLLAFGGEGFNLEELAQIKSLGFKEGQIRQLSGSDLLLDCAYRSAIALVYPSLYEGFGIPPLEAMARGCPVIASNRSSIPEVSGAAALLVDPECTAEIGSAIERMVTDQNLREMLIDKGFDQIQNFSWERCAQQTAQVYRSLDSI